MNKLCKDIKNIIFEYIKMEDLIKFRELNSIYNENIVSIIKKKRHRHVLSIGWVSYWREYVKEKTIPITIRNNSPYINKENTGKCNCEFDGCKKSPCDFIKKFITLETKVKYDGDYIMWFLVHGMEDKAIEIIKDNYRYIPSNMRQTINKYIKIGCYIKIAEYLNIKYQQSYNDSHSYLDVSDLKFNCYLYNICKNFTSKSMYLNTINFILMKNTTILKNNPENIINGINLHM